MSNIQLNLSNSTFKLEVFEDNVFIKSESTNKTSVYQRVPYITFVLKKEIPENDALQLTYLLTEYLENVLLYNTGYEGLMID